MKSAIRLNCVGTVVENARAYIDGTNNGLSRALLGISRSPISIINAGRFVRQHRHSRNICEKKIETREAE